MKHSDKKSTFTVSRFWKVVFHIFIVLGISTIIVGIVFFVLAFYYEQCYCSKPSFYEVSVFLITIGIGLSAIAFSAEQIFDHQTKNAENERNATINVYNQYIDIISSDEYIFVSKVLDDLYTIYHDTFEKLFEYASIGKGNSKEFNDIFDTIDTEEFGKALEKACSDRFEYLKLSEQTISQEHIVDIFKSYFKKVIYSFDNLCYQFISFTMDEDVYSNNIHPTVEDMFLCSIYLIYHYEMEEEILNLTYCVMLFKDGGDVI